MNIKLLFRKWTGRCIICGKKMEKHENCVHCKSKYLCHYCGKYWMFGTFYGMSRERLLKELGE